MDKWGVTYYKPVRVVVEAKSSLEAMGLAADKLHTILGYRPNLDLNDGDCHVTNESEIERANERYRNGR